jgi:uncharacterized protein YbcI
MEVPLIPHEESGHERGPMLATLSNAIVGLYKEYYGKGPTKARSYLLDDMVLCVLRGGLTRAEQTLAKSGRIAAVARQRHEFQEAVREDFVATVEAIVGRRVTAFMSTVHVDPDLNVEIFMLERDGDNA